MILSGMMSLLAHMSNPIVQKELLINSDTQDTLSCKYTEDNFHDNHPIVSILYDVTVYTDNLRKKYESLCNLWYIYIYRGDELH